MERDYQMVAVAKKMNDLFEELVEKHKFSNTWAQELTVAYFTRGYIK